MHIIVKCKYNSHDMLFQYNKNDEKVDGTVVGDLYYQNEYGSYELYTRGAKVRLKTITTTDVLDGGETNAK